MGVLLDLEIGLPDPQFSEDEVGARSWAGAGGGACVVLLARGSRSLRWVPWKQRASEGWSCQQP